MQQKKPLTAKRRAQLEAKEKKQKTLKALKIIIPSVLLAGLIIALILCLPSLIEKSKLSGLLVLTRVEDTEGDTDYYMDTEAFRIYAAAPACYEPALYEKDGKPAAYCKNLNNHLFYPIGDTPIADYLADEFTGTGTTLYYCTENHLPRLNELNPSMIRVCVSDKGNPREVRNITSPALIQATIDAFINQETVEPPFDTYEYKRDFKFYSDDYPMLYYNLTFMHTPDGDFLFDRYSKKCVDLGELYLEESLYF